ncbi:MAG: protease inhibitor I42 family protein, partial [Candidatus Eremiobacterota bacterium]
KVVLVSNTQGCLKENTLMKLKKYGINYDICLVREGLYEKDSNKLLRMKDIEEGNIKNPEYEHIPPHHIIMKIGDSGHDLYDIKKYTFKDVKDRIGRDLIIIPNPMYGNWSDSPEAYIEAKNNDTIPVTVEEGKEFTITLDSNPSTGYKWELNGIDETKVAFISCKYAKADNLLPGSGGKEIWTLKALKKGKTVISFKYARPWEKDEFSSEEKSFFILIK